MSRIRSIVYWAAAIILLVCHIVVAWQSLTQFRIWEDEAFNLTVPLNLLDGLGYTSDGTLSGSTLTPFDVRISTGPAVLLPIAGVLALGVDPVIGARLVVLAYWLLLLVGLGILGRRIGGRWAAMVAVAVPLAFNTTLGVSPIQGPTDLLGEIPAAALLVWALVVLPRRAWLAGLLVGLAIQAKLIVLLALPAFAVAMWALAPGRGWARIAATLRRSWLPLVLAGVPTLLYELSALAILGPAGFIEHLRELVWFVRDGGQKAAPTTLGEKLSTLLDAWFVPGWAALLAVVATAASIVAGLWAVRRANVIIPRSSLAVLLAALVGFATLVGWWASAAHTPLWVRHPAPGVFAFAPLLAAFGFWGARMLWRHRRGGAGADGARRNDGGSTGAVLPALDVVLAGFIGIMVAAGAVLHTIDAVTPRWESLSQQRDAVEDIAAWVHENDVEWLAADPWGASVSAVVLSGTHVGLADAPAMADVIRVTDAECAEETVIVPGDRYRVCQPR